MAVVRCNIKFSVPDAYSLDTRYRSGYYQIESTPLVTVTITNPDNSTMTQTAQWRQISNCTGIQSGSNETHYLGGSSFSFYQNTGYRWVQTDAPTMSFTIPGGQTVTQTVTEYETVTETVTETQTVTEYETVTQTVTETQTITETVTETVTQPAETVTETVTETITETVTETITETVTDVVTITEYDTVTETVTDYVTITDYETVTETITETDYETVYETITNYETITVTETETVTQVITETQATAWETVTETETVTQYETVTETITQTVTAHETTVERVTVRVTDYPTQTNTHTSACDDQIVKPIQESLYGTGMFTTYLLSQSMLSNFAAWLWSQDIADILKRWFVSPMDSVLSLSHYYGAEPNITPDVYIKVGTIESTANGLAVMERYPVQTGYINGHSNPFGGPSALLYEPYSKYSVYLPFVGDVDIPAGYMWNPNGIGRYVYYEFVSDVLTGACEYALYTRGPGSGGLLMGNDFAYVGTYQGNCATPLPISGANYQNVVNGAVGAISGIGQMALGGAAIATGVGTAMGVGLIASGAMQAAQGVMQQNNGATVQRSGSFGSAFGAMMDKTPRLICDHTNAMIASKNIKGYIDTQYAWVETFTGYLQIYEADLIDWQNDYWYINSTDVRPTDGQIAEIIDTLKKGVWL